MTHAASATAKTATRESLPPDASAPATTRVGIAGTGMPICSTNTLAKTTARPYWGTREVRSLGIGYTDLRLHCPIIGDGVAETKPELGYAPAFPPLRSSAPAYALRPV